MGEEVERPKDCHAGDRDRRADWIVRWRIEIVVDELAAGFVEEMRRQGRDVADGERVVRVIHRCTVADFIEGTDTARIETIQLIEAVASFKAVLLTEAVIAAKKDCVRM